MWDFSTKRIVQQPNQLTNQKYLNALIIKVLKGQLKITLEMKTEATSTRKWIFLNLRRFYTNQPSVHMKPVNLDTKTELFWKCTPKRFKAPVHTNPGKKYAISKMSCGHGLNIK